MKAINPRVKHDGNIIGNRFVIRFVNGIWTIFDRIEFKNCEPNLGTYKNAERVLHSVR
jgi:hypothetical protein